MRPGNYPLSLYRGDSYAWRYVLWADSAKTVPLDLAAVSVAADIRDKPGGTRLVALDCAIELPNAVVVSLAATDWATLVGVKGAWDLQLTWPTSEVTTVLMGPVTMTTDVTVTP